VLTPVWLGNPGQSRTLLSTGDYAIVAVTPPRRICQSARVSFVLARRRSGDGSEQRPRPGGWRGTPRRPSSPCSDLVGRSDFPDVRVPAPARAMDQDQLASREQLLARPPVGVIVHASGRAQVHPRQAPHDAPIVGQRGHRRQQQPRGAAGPAARQDCLEQLCVDVSVPPRTTRHERQRHRACAPAARSGLFHDHQPAPDEPVAVMQVAAAAQACTRRGRRGARPGARVRPGEARKREGDQPLARRQVVSRERGRDRLPAHGCAPSRGRSLESRRSPGTPIAVTVAPVDSVPCGGRLRSEPSTSA
jgi:hypothetical protein